jgi:hypothetical protein
MRFALDGIHGVLLIIGDTTREKFGPIFDTPAPTHTVTIKSFEGDDHVDQAESGEEHHRRHVLLVASGEEHDLVAQPHHDQQTDSTSTRASRCAGRLRVHPGR